MLAGTLSSSTHLVPVAVTTHNVIHCFLLLIADSDGDLIVISSDEELVDALGQFDGTIFRLHLLKSKAN